MTGRQVTEAALRESDARFRAMFEQAAVGIAVADLEGRWLEVNQHLCDMLGYTTAELRGVRFWDVTHPDDVGASLGRRRAMLEGAPAYTFEKRYLHKDGSIVWVSLTASMMRDTAGSRGVSIAIIRDITPRKVAEAALRQSEERFRVTFEQAAVGMTMVAPDGRFLRVNQCLCDMVGYAAEELQALTFMDITHPDDRARNVALRQPMLDGRATSYAIEKRYVHKNGSIVWIEMTASLPVAGSGTTGYSIGVIKDITERKAAAAALQQSEERFRVTFEQAPVGMSVVALDGRFVRVNQCLCDMVGYTSDELLAMTFQDITHPDDRTISVTRRQSLLDRQMPAYSMEKRYVHKDGSIVWIHLTVSLSHYASATTDTSIAIIQNITERRVAELALRASEERFRVTFEEAAVGMSVITLGDGRFIRVNQCLCDMVGYTAEELSALTVQDITHPDDRALQGNLRQPMLAGQARSYSMEKRLVHKNGGVVWIHMTASLPRDAAGAAHYAIAIAQDVTTRKQLSGRLIEVQEAERRTIARELHDEIGQTLTALKINLQTLPALSDAAMPGRIVESIAMVTRLLDQVRAMSLDLRPAVLDDWGLTAAVAWYAERYNGRSGLAVNVRSHLGDARLPVEIETGCFRIVQEAVTNAIRHAHAHHVSIELRRRPGAIEVTVGDDGTGFDVAFARQRAAAGASLGLLGMQDRAFLLGGDIDFVSTPGRGTQVRASIPLRSAS